MDLKEYLKEEKRLYIRDLKKRKVLLWEAFEILELEDEKKIIIKKMKEIDMELEEAIRND